jgi:threonine aldolase
VTKRAFPPHAALHRDPHAVLTRLLARTAPGTGPDEPVAELERRVAELLGTPAALFLPTGAMAQQIAVRLHAERTGRAAFAAHPTCHLDLWEERGYAVVHGLRFRPAGDAALPLTADALRAVGEPLAAVVWELPQREIGGTLPEWGDLVAQVALVRERGAAAHLDGARLWEAQPFYDRPHAEIAGLFDTVYVSLYKGLRGVRGAALAGDEETIAAARVWRTRLGGAVPDAWPLALAALDGLDRHLPRMAEYRDHAVAVAAAITADGIGRVVPDPPVTPMFHLHLPAPAEALAAAAAAVDAERDVLLFRRATATTDPGRSVVELTVSDTGLEFTPAEVAGLVAEIVERATRT